MSLNLQQQRNTDLKLTYVVGYRYIHFYKPVLMAAPLLTKLGLERVVTMNFVAGFDTTACNDQVSGSGLRQRQSQIHPFYHVLRAGIRGHAETDR